MYYSKKSINFINGNGELISLFAASEQFEGLTTTELDKGAAGFDDFEHKKKFLDPSFINFSSAFKPARTTPMFPSNHVDDSKIKEQKYRDSMQYRQKLNFNDVKMK